MHGYHLENMLRCLNYQQQDGFVMDFALCNMAINSILNPK